MSDMNEIERWYAYGDENGDGPWNDDIDEDEDDEGSTITCQNCAVHLTLPQAQHGTLVCGDKCKQTAKAVRYGRATRRDGRYERDPLVREALEQRIAHILGGGYPERDRALSPEQREAIFTRDGGHCRLCGAPATEIDHIAGSSADPENLQALCKPCTMAKARANFRGATSEEEAEGEAIWARITAEPPSRLCDDETKWDKLWRKIASEQRKRARETTTC